MSTLLRLLRRAWRFLAGLDSRTTLRGKPRVVIK
jgi:hypothetical protein